MEPKSWRIYYASGDHAQVTADHYVDAGDWVEFVETDGTVVRRERVSGITRIILRNRRRQPAGGDESPPPAQP